MLPELLILHHGFYKLPILEMRWQRTVSEPHFGTANSQRLDFGQSVSDRGLTLAED
jgi:hypothetical protein